MRAVGPRPCSLTEGLPYLICQVPKFTQSQSTKSPQTAALRAGCFGPAPMPDVLQGNSYSGGRPPLETSLASAPTLFAHCVVLTVAVSVI